MKNIKKFSVIFITFYFIGLVHVDAKSNTESNLKSKRSNNSAPVNSQNLNQALLAIQNGSYLNAQTILKNEDQGDVRIQYWSGQIQFKLQNYDKAIEHFQLAVTMDKKNEFNDTSYLLGQSYYSTQDYPKAKVAFQSSIQKKYKPAPSLYYVGYIENILNDNEKAMKHFEEIIKLPNFESEEMKQPAQFQIGEIFFEKARKIKIDPKDRNYKINLEFQEELLSKHAIPAYKAVIEINDEKALAKQADGRIQEARALMAHDAPKTESGLPKPKQPWYLKLSEDIKYDTNVVNEADGKLVKVANSASFLSKSGMLAKYEMFPVKSIATTPELDASGTLHSRRNTPQIFTNDSYSINPAIRNRYDHILLGKPSAGLAEFEGTYMQRDFIAQHNFAYYNSSFNTVFGERLQIFPWAFMGQTSFKANFKLFWSQNKLQNYYSPGGSITQNWSVYKAHMIISTLTYESQFAKDKFYDQKSYKVNLSYSIANLPWNVTGDLACSFTVTDTVNQKNTRGYERTVAPTLTLNKHFDRHFGINLNYAYTNNASKDDVSYQYSKHIIGLGTAYEF